MIAVFDGWISDIHFFQPFFFLGKTAPIGVKIPKHRGWEAGKKLDFEVPEREKNTCGRHGGRSDRSLSRQSFPFCRQVRRTEHMGDVLRQKGFGPKLAPTPWL